jgi:hypothetical protein
MIDYRSSDEWEELVRGVLFGFLSAPREGSTAPDLILLSKAILEPGVSKTGALLEDAVNRIQKLEKDVQDLKNVVAMRAALKEARQAVRPPGGPLGQTLGA